MKKTCVCQGIRWCAACTHPQLRREHGMHAPFLLPAALANGPPSVNSDDSIVHAFDPSRQCAPTAPSLRGLRVVPDFITTEEAIDLLSQIEARPFEPAQSGKGKQHFGPRINFKKQRVTRPAAEPLPDYAKLIERRVRRCCALDDSSLPDAADLQRALAAFRGDDLFVLRYAPERKSNLDLHIDDIAAYGELIADLSLESDSTLTFVDVPQTDSSRTEPTIVRVPLPARSLALLFGPARYRWHHGVLAYDIHARRTSITLRSISLGVES